MSRRIINRRCSQKKIASSPKKVLVSAEGGQVFISGSFKYHVFTSTDYFRVFYKASTPSTLYFDYLLVSGGQPGGSGINGEYNGGDGGAGGNGGSGSYRTEVSKSFGLFNIDTPYVVTIGGGGSPSTLSTNSSTITSAGDSVVNGGVSGSGAVSNPTCTEPLQFGCPQELVCDENNENCVCPVDEEWLCPSNCTTCQGTAGTNGSNGGAAFSNNIIFGGPSGSYAAGGGGGGGGGGYSGGATGGSAARGLGGTGGNPGGAGSNGSPNSGDGGCGGGGGDPCCNNGGSCPSDANQDCNVTKYGGAGGSGGSGILYIKYLFEQ